MTSYLTNKYDPNGFPHDYNGTIDNRHVITRGKLPPNTTNSKNVL